MDRIDMQVDVPAVSISDLQNAGQGESSAQVRSRIEAARDIQFARFNQLKANVSINAHAQGEVLEKIVELQDDAKVLLNKAMENAKVSARGYYRILKVARTIADLDNGAAKIGKTHIAEALSYRRIAYS